MTAVKNADQIQKLNTTIQTILEIIIMCRYTNEAKYDTSKFEV